MKQTPAEAHRRTRSDHALETAEDYVEAVLSQIEQSGRCRVVDLTRRFGVSHVTVSRAIGRLVRLGLVTTVPYQPIALTAKGKRIATRARERHLAVYRFLRAIGVGHRVASIDAEGIEHHVSPSTLAAMRRIADSGPAPGRARKR